MRSPLIQRYKNLLLAGFAACLMTFGVIAAVSSPVYAIDKCKNAAEQADPKKQCIGGTINSANDPLKNCKGEDCGLIVKYVNPFITFLSAAVGIVITISIVVGGIQYSTSAGDSSKITKAKERIRNAVLALLAYFFLFAFLQWLIPGGVL